MQAGSSLRRDVGKSFREASQQGAPKFTAPGRRHTGNYKKAQGEAVEPCRSERGRAQPGPEKQGPTQGFLERYSYVLVSSSTKARVQSPKISRQLSPICERQRI